MFVPQKTVYKLDFGEGTGLDGLEILANACSVDEFNKMIDLGGQATSTENNNAALQIFIDHVVDWNLSLDGTNKLPVEVASLGQLENPLVIRILGTWQAAMMTVPNLSKSRSDFGATSEERSLGLANGSASPRSWPE